MAVTLAACKLKATKHLADQVSFNFKSNTVGFVLASCKHTTDGFVLAYFKL